MFRQDGFIPRAFVPTVRSMKTFVEIAMSAAMLALWAVAVMVTVESTAQPARATTAKPAVVASTSAPAVPR